MEFDNLMVFLSNIALVIVTGATIWITIREEHRHDEKDESATAAIADKLVTAMDSAMKREQNAAHDATEENRNLEEDMKGML